MADSEYDLSQSQTQTQPQTQLAASQALHPTPPSFPTNLWGLLVSLAPPSASLAAIPQIPYVERPARIELPWNDTAKNELTVGRAPKSGLVLAGNKISAKHARIFWDEEEEVVKLEDISTNGTWVRDSKVGKGNVTVLDNGDSIVFGPPTSNFAHDFRYTFHCSSSGAASRSPPWEFGGSDGGGLREAYEVFGQIGKGSFATVHKGVQKSTGSLVAIKVIAKQRFIKNPKTMEMFTREVNIMKKLDHKFCVKCIDHYEDAQRIWLVLEYVDGGDLLDYIMNRKGLSEGETREIALMVCEAVAYLHSQGVAHRDLKPENLLLTRGLRPLCKVTDFGLAKMVSDGTMLKTMCGTPTYLAPEVILKNDPNAGYGPVVDAWSVGVILYSCMTNQTPFDESESTPLPERMLARRVDFSPLEEANVSPTAIDFINKLLLADPNKRMTIKQALNHPWLASTANPDAATLPLLVSSLPYNGGGHSSSLAPAISTASDSFVDSQGMNNLRIAGSPARQSLASASITTPDRVAEDIATEAGDISIDVASTVGLPTPNISHTNSFTHLPAVNGDLAMTDDHLNGATSNGHATSPTSVKRKQPASAFSSESELDDSPARDGAQGEGSAMSLDASFVAPPPPLPLPTPSVPLEPQQSLPFDLPAVPESKVLEVESKEEPAPEIEEEAPGPEVQEEEAPKPKRSTRRTSAASSARASTTPRRRSARPSRGATPAAASESDPNEERTPEPAPVVGMTTRRRAKAARLA
ncbi:kinase-like domain-containing protein [Leucosporidium creatinivorum]|uniref:Kinase-like domain-containing protein n=1 Tax=Leucosporidium creatinivorum TaxID=106004 RepID=A0A1Y2G261_9BASI|nr:kinase-like domain-containing protein [Leucosporidium creatinivorum]